MDYSLAQFETDVQRVKPRIFDTYILPPFLMYYAVQSKGMRKNARRMLFTAGVYMVYRNYAEYKKAVVNLRRKLLENQNAFQHEKETVETPE